MKLAEGVILSAAKNLRGGRVTGRHRDSSRPPQAVACEEGQALCAIKVDKVVGAVTEIEVIITLLLSHSHSEYGTIRL